jgi:hypothetical protein
MIEVVSRDAPVSEITFVGGPHARLHHVTDRRPPEISLPGGTYRPSVLRADNGAIQYVWIPKSPEDGGQHSPTE